MGALNILDRAGSDRVSAAVNAAERHTSGEIVTILTEKSDEYGDIALAWAALVGLIAMIVTGMSPGIVLDIAEWLSGGWIQRWTVGMVMQVAAIFGFVKFAAVWLILLWMPLRIALVPGWIRNTRVRRRAITAFRIGAERRTHGRTGILIYLSMREHRAEIVADEAITSKVTPDVWADAMAAMLAELKQGRTADGLVAAIERVGAILALHCPRAEDDVNELPDRLIEI